MALYVNGQAVSTDAVSADTTSLDALFFNGVDVTTAPGGFGLFYGFLDSWSNAYTGKINIDGSLLEGTKNLGTVSHWRKNQRNGSSPWRKRERRLSIITPSL